MGMRPDNRHVRERHRTLGQLVIEKMALVAICRRCGHRRVLYPANYIARFGEHCFAIELRERLRCTQCRGRMANLHESAR
jgi:DNA-directed RNA polymerase subunit RPC12/RpoP